MNFKPLLVLLLALSVSFGDEGFKRFLQEEFGGYEREKGEFRKYLEEVNREFEEYKRITYEEFRRFKGEVLKHWDHFEATDRKKLVQYSKDFRVKRVFNFETGELRIEVKGDKKELKKVLRKELKDFVKENKRSVFLKDPLISNIERKSKKLKYVKRGKIENEPLIAPIVLGSADITQSELNRGVEKLLTKGVVQTKKTKKGKVSMFRVKIPPKHILMKARQYKGIVSKESKRWKLSPSLIFAIIHTESYFNPMARSHVPAYGLMQIVPHSAGRDVTKFLFGRPMILSPSYLYNAKNNIKIGSTYVHMLYYKYFKGVKDPQSRLYCTIAAYNTGAGNVARALTGTRNLKRAIKVINRLSPDDVYRVLMRNLPYQETKDYLRKVSARIAVYKNL